MLTTPVLSAQQIDEFERNGFLIVRSAFNAADMEKIDRWGTEALELPEISGQHWVYHETSLTEPRKNLVSRIEKIAPFHQGFQKLSEALKKPVGQILEDEAELFKEKINFKMPGGDGFKPHQDSQAGWNAYADFFVSVMVTIDEATEENGCLQVVPGHHKRGLFTSWEPLSDKDLEGMEFVPCPTKPGDIVFFNNFTPHSSEPNTSDDIRRAYYVTYNRLSAGRHMDAYYADKHKNYPPDIDREAGKEYVFKV